MKGIAENDLRAEFLGVFRQDALYRAIGADRHERRRFHRTARKRQPAATGDAVGAQ